MKLSLSEHPAVLVAVTVFSAFLAFLWPNRAFAQTNVFPTGGNVGIGTTSPTASLEVKGTAKVNGVALDPAVRNDDAVLFAPQVNFEAGSLPLTTSLSGAAPSFEAVSSSTVPFSKVAVSNTLTEFASDFIPVQAGETLYGEIWAMRQTGSSGIPGALYYGVAQFDKDKRPISVNIGLNYFVVANSTVAQDGLWKKYTGTITLPLSHTPYAGSDGGPVRYVKAYVIVNYNAGTIPTYWGGVQLRRVAPFRGSGPVAFSGNVGIGTTNPDHKLSIFSDAREDGIVVDSAAYPEIAFRKAGTAKGYIGIAGDAGGFFNNSIADALIVRSDAGPIQLGYNSANPTVTLSTSGNVGVGTTNPSAKLEVAGDTKVTGNLTVSGTFSAPNYTATSGNLTGSSANGLTLSAGGTNQSVTITPSGTGAAVINGNLRTTGNTLQISGQKTHLLTTLSGETPNPTADSYRYEVARICVNSHHWQWTGPIEVELREAYWAAGGYLKFVITAGYEDFSGTVTLVEKFGSGLHANVTLGAPVSTGTSYAEYGNQYIPIYVDLGYYTRWNVKITHEWALVDSDVPTNPGEMKLFGAPARSMLTNYVATPGGQGKIGSREIYAGRLGLGTVSPAANLEIDNGNSAGVLAYFGARSISGAKGLVLTKGTTGGPINIQGTRSGASGGAEDLVLQAEGGNVGIGTTSPGTKLEVVGNIAASSPAGFVQLWQDNSVIWKAGASQGGLRFGSATDLAAGYYSEKMRILDNGNVGIGTSSPGNLLEVRGAAGTTGIVINDQKAASGSSSKLQFGLNDGVFNTNAAAEVSARVTTNPNMALDFKTYHSSLQTDMTITQGNVGIGTSTPGTTLEVAGGPIRVDEAAGIQFSRSYPNDHGRIYVDNSDGTVMRSHAHYGYKWSTSVGPVMGLTQSGNLGIGTLTPSGKLSIVTGAPTSGSYVQAAPGSYGLLEIGIPSAVDNKSFLSLHRGGAVAYQFGISGNDFVFAQTSGAANDSLGAERLRITSNGNVGIGTTAPTAKLEVNGNTKITGTLIAAQSGTFGGDLNLTNAQGNNWAIKNDGGNFALSTTSTSGGATPLKFDRATQAATFGGAVKLGDNAWSLSQSGSAFYLSGTTGTALTIDNGHKATFAGAIESAGTATFSGKVTAADGLIVTGRVGIGTSTPSRPLEVMGAPLFVLNNANEQFTLRFPQTQYGALRFQNEWYVTQGGTGWGAEIRTQDIGGGGGNLVFMTSPTDQGANVQPIARMEIKADGNVVMNGNVGIGTAATAGAKLSVEGLIRAREVVVDPTSVQWADYVFADGYRNAPLSDVEAHIKEYKHLPGVPSAKEVADKGVNVGQMQAVLLQKIEELTLHMIEQEKEMKTLRSDNTQLKQRVAQLESSPE